MNLQSSLDLRRSWFQKRQLKSNDDELKLEATKNLTTLIETMLIEAT